MKTYPHHVGILHVHSNLSYDGQNTLAEIASLAKLRGYRFVGMREHSDTFEPQKMADLVDECPPLSENGVRNCCSAVSPISSAPAGFLEGESA
jgi:hypothetical protein